MASPARVVALSYLSLGVGLLSGCGQASDDAPGTSAGGGGAKAGAGGAGTAASGKGGTSNGGSTAGGNGTSRQGGAGGQAGVVGVGGATGGAGTEGKSGEAGGAPAPELIDLQTVLDTYRSFQPQTPEPVSVSSYIFGLCRLPTLPEEQFAASIHGDGRYLRDWANIGAVEGIAARGAPPFPPGAVIVKEKYAGPQVTEADVVALGIMIKRQAGFNTAHGDWDYAYYEPALGMVQTAAQSAYCAECHAGAEATDFVYVDGLQP